MSAASLALLAYPSISLPAAPPTPPPGARLLERPLRLCFESYDGDVSKPETLTFVIQTIYLTASSKSLKIGDTIPNTKFKLKTFKYAIGGSANVEEFDASKLTLINIETNEPIVFMLGQNRLFPNTHYVPSAPKK